MLKKRSFFIGEFYSTQIFCAAFFIRTYFDLVDFFVLACTMQRNGQIGGCAVEQDAISIDPATVDIIYIVI